MEVNRVLLYGGFALFLVTFVLRLYFGMKTKEVRLNDPERINTEEGKKFKRLNYTLVLLFWAGTTMMMFSF